MTTMRGRSFPDRWALSSGMAARARAEYLTGARIRALAEKFHVSYGTMQAIISGRHRSVRGTSLARGRHGRPNQ